MNDVIREVALIEELHTAIGLAQLGLGCLQRIDGTNDFYHLPLQLLASGKERLLKVMLCVHAKARTGSYPSQEQIIGYGHNIEESLNTVTSPAIFGVSWVRENRGCAEDLALLSSDQLYRRMVAILSHFGQNGRYSNLDVVAGKPQIEEEPQLNWKRVEISLLSSDELAGLGTAEGYRAARHKVNGIMVITLERAFRALSRWFTLGGGAPAGKAHSGILMPFLRLKEDDLGHTQWPGAST